MHGQHQLEDTMDLTVRKSLSRRDFMQALSVAATAGPGVIAAGLSGFALTRTQRAEAAEVIAYEMGKLPKRAFGSRLGKMKVSPVCICQDWSPDLFGPALEMGVNFVHKAGYWGEVPEELKKKPRESYYTDITVDSTPDHPDDYDRAYNQVSHSLEKNGLKYYDIFRAHFGWRSVQDFKTKTNTYKAFQRLKREGKVKYFGVSQHGGPFDGGYAPYTEMIAAEIESGIVDAMQVWYSYKYPKEVQEIFAKASKAGIGMTAMKIYATGRGQMSKDTDRQAALKASGHVGKALIRQVMTTKREDGKPIFHTCVSALSNLQIFEENLSGLSQKVASAEGFTDQHLYLA